MPAPIEPVTARLLLRQWRESDREPFADLNADPAVMEHFPAPLSREVSDALFDRCAAGLAGDRYGLWALEVRQTGVLLGFVGLSHPTFDAAFTPCTEIGWRLARGGWGHGYATEAARAALEVAFDVLGEDEVVSFTFEGNRLGDAAGRRVQQRGCDTGLATVDPPSSLPSRWSS